MGWVTGPERAFLLGILAFTLFGAGVGRLFPGERGRSAADAGETAPFGGEAAPPADAPEPAPSLAEEARALAGPLTLLDAQRARVEEAVRRAAAAESRGAARGAQPASGAAPVDLNRASAAELEALPGVGPALARRIVEERARGGPYRSVADLARVKGIGPRTVERIGASATADSVQNALAGGDSP